MGKGHIGRNKMSHRTEFKAPESEPQRDGFRDELTTPPAELETTPMPATPTELEEAAAKDTAAMREEMSRKAEAQRRARERAPLLQVAVETGLLEEDGTTWWPALAPLTNDERRLVKATIAQQRTGGYGR